MSDPRLIVPLDVPTADDARAMVAALGDSVSFYKVGLELLATDGMTLARELKAGGKQVFLDVNGCDSFAVSLFAPFQPFSSLRQSLLRSGDGSLGGLHSGLSLICCMTSRFHL